MYHLAHARLGDKGEALADLAQFQKSEVPESAKLYLAAVVAAEQGEAPDKAFERLEAALKEQPIDLGLYYNTACAYALASQAYAKTDQAKSRNHAERAIHLLQAAIRNGYSNYSHMQEDSDLDPLRDLPAFAEIMKGGHPDRRYTAVWTFDAGYEATPSYGLDPAAHLQRCRELASHGYRILALSVARTTPECCR